MKINTKNEYGKLKSIIVGRPDHANWPVGDPIFDNMCELSTYPTRLQRGPVPLWVVQQAREDMFKFIDLLGDNDVQVYRPELTDWTKATSDNRGTRTQMHSYSARDLLLSLPNMMIETPTPFTSRQNETEAYHYIRYQAIQDGVKWIKAPRAMMEPAECKTVGGRIKLTERYPIFDAANVMKFDDKLLYLVSATANKLGAKWLQSVVGTEFEVITWEGVYAFAHIDSTLASLNKDTVVLNASRCNDDNIPKFMKDMKKIYVKDMAEREFHHWPYASKWIGMNVLALDPETVFVDPIQKDFIETLKANKFRVIETPLRQSRTLGGGFHCITCDLERE